MLEKRNLYNPPGSPILQGSKPRGNLHAKFHLPSPFYHCIPHPLPSRASKQTKSPPPTTTQGAHPEKAFLPGETKPGGPQPINKSLKCAPLSPGPASATASMRRANQPTHPPIASAQHLPNSGQGTTTCSRGGCGTSG